MKIDVKTNTEDYLILLDKVTEKVKELEQAVNELNDFEINIEVGEPRNEE